MSSTDTCQMRLRREMLAKSPAMRQQAITEFILSTAHAAGDLRGFVEMRRYGADLSPKAMEYAQYIEDVIRRRHRECFGSELGGEVEGA